ncbi:MAG: molybdopterin-dependent oxidoreductase [Chloroflexi bacterium]|nr:molybdopterin-dependent oxidoreductase [Chloroflexota bacterium]MCL5108378.1 molybdopterin-dependent oxidoreductase [Chloroflexota bacterium]
MEDRELMVTRRDFVRLGAFLGAGALLATQAPRALGAVGQAPGSADGAYPLAGPEQQIYSACLQCNTQCTIKGKILNGLLLKIDGSPYGPQTMLPQISYSTPLDQAARVDGKLCPKGQAGIQTIYDPYRIRKVLKRAGPRGSSQWQTIPFDQAIKEIVQGGKLFASIGEDRVVPGLKDLFVIKDAKTMKALADDASAVAKKTMTLAEFKSKHASELGLLIDPDHPDLGPKNNQLVFLAGRIEPGRNDYSKRWVISSFGSNNWYDHTSICEQSHHIAYSWMTAQYNQGAWATGPNHMKPDFTGAEFVIFWGTSPFEANFGPASMTEQITQGMVERGLQFAVVDPRMSKTAAKAKYWVPIKPGDGDAALAMGMIRWIIDNERYDKVFLQSANKAAATAHLEKSWTNSTLLVKIDDQGVPGKLLRAKDAGLSAPEGKDAAHLFVMSKGGQLVAVDPADDKNAVEGDLVAEATGQGFRAKTAFQLLKEEAAGKGLEEYAQIAGVSVAQIQTLAQELTGHGKKAAVEFYRGAVQHTNGYYVAQALVTLNLLIGNLDWKGGLNAGGGAWASAGGKDNQPFDLGKQHAGKIAAFGLKVTREGTQYEATTLFKGYPAPRPFYPFTSNVYQEVIPAIDAQFPYPVKILWLHKGTPVLATPAGGDQIRMLRDVDKLPLFIADDIVIGETSMYADYLFPDLSYAERWAFLGLTPSEKTKGTKIRQPIIAPIPETVTVFGEQMPISMDAMMLAFAEALGTPGYGKGGFADGIDFTRPEDYYLKAVANIGAGDAANDAVPAADAEEIRIFREARQQMPPSVFDEAKWKRAVGEANWGRTVYVLNRGGRFEGYEKAYSGNYLGHPYGKLVNLYVEPVGSAKDSITGKPFSGVAKYEPIKNSDGSVLKDEEFPFYLVTFKEVTGCQTRTPGNYWSQIAVTPENRVRMNPKDVAGLGLKEGDLVRFASRTNQAGTIEVVAGKPEAIVGKVQAAEGVRPGTVQVSFSYGHWAYGAREVQVDGQKVPGDARRGTGLCTNPLLALDQGTKTTCLTDPIGGSASFYDTRVKVMKA